MELRAFAQAIRQQAPHINTPEEADRDLAVIEALLQSAASRQTVAVP
jgi:predicted dehydrogenase